MTDGKTLDKLLEDSDEPLILRVNGVLTMPDKMNDASNKPSSG